MKIPDVDIGIKKFIKESRLDYAVQTYHNILDKQIDRLINTLKTEIKEKEKEYDSIDTVIDVKGGVIAYRELNKKINSYINEINHKKDELLALYEVKVIYSYKYFEIRIKELLKTAYEDDSIPSLHNWDNLKKYLKKKGITISDLDRFSDIDELRRVNNTFKHSGSMVSDEIKNISEFSNKDQILYNDIERFYTRVNDSPKEFLELLAIEIYNDLFLFDEEKIKRIAKSLAARMEKETAEEFIDTFSKLYK